MGLKRANYCDLCKTALHHTNTTATHSHGGLRDEDKEKKTKKNKRTDDGDKTKKKASKYRAEKDMMKICDE